MEARASATHGAFSVEEWAAQDEPGEFVDGRLVEEEVPDLVHESVVAWLVATLRAVFIPLGGFVFGSEAKFAVSPHRGRKPDATVFFGGGSPPPRRGVVRAPPDIAIEVVSPAPRDGRRDRIEKLLDYATFGVRYYWILDPEERSLEVLELGSDGRYVHALGAAEGRVDNVPGAPGLVLDLDALWAEIDRLGPPST
ncbi:MAG TPA: Uma2 family endonuclease [Polyangiaceae bacterium]